MNTLDINGSFGSICYQVSVMFLNFQLRQEIILAGAFIASVIIWTLLCCLCRCICCCRLPTCGTGNRSTMIGSAPVGMLNNTVYSFLKLRLKTSWINHTTTNSCAHFEIKAVKFFQRPEMVQLDIFTKFYEARFLAFLKG